MVTVNKNYSQHWVCCKLIKVLDMKLLFNIGVSILLFLSSCKPLTQNEQMLKTGNAVVKSIQNSKPNDFIELIGVPLKAIGKNEEMVISDFNNLKHYFEQYKITPQFEFSNSLNDLGQKIISVFKINDTLGKRVIEFILKFGPPQINPLNKVSGYEINVNYYGPITLIPPKES